MNILEQLKNKPDLTEQQKLALDNCIALFVTGSHLYGTSIPSSDFDFEGLFLEEPEYVVGTKRCDEVDFSTGDDKKRNTSEDIDCKLYSVRKFFELAKQNNPNKCEWFFIPESCFVYKNERYWNNIVENKDLFLCQKLKYSFSGYAHSQEHKLLTKKKRFIELSKFLEILKKEVGVSVRIIGQLGFMFEDVPTKKYDRETDKVVTIINKRLKYPFESIYYKKSDEGVDGIQVDQKYFNYGMGVESLVDYVTKEVEKYGQRTRYIQEYGYDLKFSSHLFRLHYEGLQLLEEGKLDLPFTGEKQQFMIDIKNGKYSLYFLISKYEELKPSLEIAYEKTKLRHSPDDKAISKLQMKMHFNYWRDKKLIG